MNFSLIGLLIAVHCPNLYVHFIEHSVLLRPRPISRWVHKCVYAFVCVRAHYASYMYFTVKPCCSKSSSLLWGQKQSRQQQTSWNPPYRWESWKAEALNFQLDEDDFFVDFLLVGERGWEYLCGPDDGPKHGAKQHYINRHNRYSRFHLVVHTRRNPYFKSLWCYEPHSLYSSYLDPIWLLDGMTCFPACTREQTP